MWGNTTRRLEDTLSLFSKFLPLLLLLVILRLSLCCSVPWCCFHYTIGDCMSVLSKMYKSYMKLCLLYLKKVGGFFCRKDINVRLSCNIVTFVFHIATLPRS